MFSALLLTACGDETVLHIHITVRFLSYNQSGVRHSVTKTSQPEEKEKRRERTCPCNGCLTRWALLRGDSLQTYCCPHTRNKTSIFRYRSRLQFCPASYLRVELSSIGWPAKYTHTQTDPVKPAAACCELTKQSAWLLAAYTHLRSTQKNSSK